MRSIFGRLIPGMRIFLRFFEWVIGDEKKTHELFWSPYLWTNAMAYKTFYQMLVASKLAMTSIGGIFSVLQRILSFISKGATWAQNMRLQIDPTLNNSL